MLDRLNLPIADQFYGERGLGIRTGVSLVYSVDRINVKLAEEAKGGGGGAEAEGGLTVRGNFQDTAYWKADVTTNADGTATVSFSLPDNLTTWRMSAIAITKDGLVGEGQSDVRSTKDLLIRPVTPRFMIVGDKFNMGAVINNNTANDLPVDVTLEGTGITIDNGQVKQSVTVPANSAVRVNWPVTVLDAPYADLTFSVRGGGLSDASKPTAGLPPDQHLPIYKYSTPDVTATSGNVTKEDPVRNEAIILPQKHRCDAGHVDGADRSVAGGGSDGRPEVSGALSVRMHRANGQPLPAECVDLSGVEGTQSGRSRRWKRNLKEQVSVGLQRLNNQQHVDGGWGWWVNEKSSVTTSIYVVFGLVKAQQAGFPIDPAVLDKGVKYLTNNILVDDGHRHAV